MSTSCILQALGINPRMQIKLHALKKKKIKFYLKASLSVIFRAIFFHRIFDFRAVTRTQVGNMVVWVHTKQLPDEGTVREI